MKTKFWVLLFALLLLVCGGLSLPLLLPGEAATHAEVLCDGELIHTLDLHIDREIVHQSSYGTNTITVKDGKIAVTEADCPDHYCMQRGYCNSGTQIVCLPNRLVIRFVGAQEVDMVVG